MSTGKDKVIASLMVLGATVMFASKGIIVKLAYEYQVDSLSLLTLRMVFAFPLFVLLWFFTFKNNAATKSLRTNWWKVSLLGILGYHIASYLSFLGISMITASMERVLLTTYPTMVVILSFIIFRKKIKVYQSGALVLTYIGIIIAFSQGLIDDQQTDFLLGGSLVLLCAFSYALYMVFGESLIRLLGSQLFNASSLIAACISIFLHYLIANQFTIASYSKEVLGYALVLAVFSTVLPTMLFTEGIRRIGASNSAIITSLGPICTIMLAYLVLGESLNVIQWIGSLMVIGGVSIVVLHKSM